MKNDLTQLAIVHELSKIKDNTKAALNVQSGGAYVDTSKLAKDETLSDVNDNITDVNNNILDLASLSFTLQELTSRLSALAATIHATNQTMRVSVISIPTTGIVDVSTPLTYAAPVYIKYMELMAIQNNSAVQGNINNVVVT